VWRANGDGGRGLHGGCRDKIEHQEIGAETAIAEQFNVALNLPHRVIVIAVEIARDADQARRRPIDGICILLAKAFPEPAIGNPCGDPSANPDKRGLD
jgi:hypothetical protein